MFSGNVPSLSDIAAVTNNGNDGFGGNNGWWILIILFALFGWGRGGYGEGNGNGTNSEVQRGFDTQSIISKLDGINNGICSLGYDQLAQMNNIRSDIQQVGIANMQDTNSLSRQLADCCCENRQAIAQVRYDMATDTCAITNAINQQTQNIMQNDNNNYRQLHDEIVAIQMQAKDEKIAEQQSLIQSLNLAQSQANQNQFFQGQIEGLYDRLSPCPKPAYWVQNPNCCQGPWGPFGFNGYNGFGNFGNDCCGRNSCCN